jgi:DNA invertase Pin-like site-specific DNA recombinase
METYFYLRISTSGQQVDSQLQEIKKHPQFDPKNVFIDKISGSIPFLERPEAVKLFDVLTKNKNQKTLVVYSWERIGRNLLDLIKTVELLSDLKINIHSTKECIDTLLPNGQPNQISKLALSILSNLAEMNLRMQKEKCADGIAQAKLRGAYKGRKLGSTQTDVRLLERHQVVVKKLTKGLTVREINEITGRSSATILKIKKVLVKRKLL